MSDNTLITVDKCSKYYGDFAALKEISFTVKRGEIVGFLGPNGAGKSTTMKLITGYLNPTAGRVLVAGEEVSPNSLSTREKIGYLPENAPLYEDMMVDEFLDFAAKIRHLSGAEGVRRKAMVIERCGLKPVLGKDIGTLSKGYRQRVGLAQAIIHDPPILILDEPTSGLDPNQIVDIRALIKELGREKTVILSTHILPEVQATCNRVIIINNGRLVADDTPENMTVARGGGSLLVGLAMRQGGAFDEVAAKRLLANLEAVSKVEKLSTEGTVELFKVTHGATDIRLKLFEEVAKSPLAIMHLAAEQVSLEETFRHLTLDEKKEAGNK